MQLPLVNENMEMDIGNSVKLLSTRPQNIKKYELLYGPMHLANEAPHNKSR